MASAASSARRSRAARPKAASESLRAYAGKRDFAATPEPAGDSGSGGRRRRGGWHFVVQKHAARRLHYDFRLELDGTLKSWAVPKGPSLDPAVKRLAVEVEDHPLAYADFEGRIPAGHYGAGEVLIWDRGRWQADDADPAAAYRAGRIKFHLLGEKLAGGWTLVRTRRGQGGGKGESGERGAKAAWLLIKERDVDARPEADYDIVAARPESVVSGARLAPQPESEVPKAKPAKPAATAKKAEKAEKAAEAMQAAPAAARPPHARKAPLPPTLAPQLATLVERPPAGDWRYEIKFDGYRLLARIDGEASRSVRLFTRNGLDWSERLAPLVAALRALAIGPAWLDGEIVVLDADGVPDFQALQNAFDAGRTAGIVYYVFDLPYHAGLDLRAAPLEARRARLQGLLADADRRRVRYSEAFAASGGDILQTACTLRLEGVIGKRAGSPYASRRSGDWIKLKCGRRQEFVIGGYSPPQGGRHGFGALLLGVHDGAALRYAGRVGTGFSVASLDAVLARMRPLARRTPPFATPPAGRDAAGVTWLEPRLVCEVAFSGWTRDGRVRQAVFHGLRDDKPARTIVREAGPASAARQAAGRRPAARQHDGREAEHQAQHQTQRQADPPAARGQPRSTVAGIEISHPDRVIDAASGTTKAALAERYRELAPYLLPVLAGRPLAILRAPDGIAGEQFFQRHAGKLAIPSIREIEVGEGGDETLMQIDKLPALIGAVQMGGVEFHPWNARSDDLDRPDRIIFDLDPDPTLPWSRVVDAARLLLALLDELGLAAFVKTSGGKGLHVVVPLARRQRWDAVKAFARAVAQHLARVLPRHFADRMGPQNRVGKVFVDYLRNQPGASTVAAWSLRARPGLPVSVPIGRDELDGLDGLGGAAAWTVRNIDERLHWLAGHADPWAGYAHRQTISREMQRRLAAK